MFLTPSKVEKSIVKIKPDAEMKEISASVSFYSMNTSVDKGSEPIVIAEYAKLLKLVKKSEKIHLKPVTKTILLQNSLKKIINQEWKSISTVINPRNPF